MWRSERGKVKWGGGGSRGCRGQRSRQAHSGRLGGSVPLSLYIPSSILLHAVPFELGAVYIPVYCLDFAVIFRALLLRENRCFSSFCVQVLRCARAAGAQAWAVAEWTVVWDTKGFAATV